MRVLTWNLFHGRGVPGAGRDLNPEFAAAIASWAWDVALLQEVPPWWGPSLGTAAGASARVAPTSRNWLLPLRRLLARRLPDRLKSEGGGANAILVRGQAIQRHEVAVLRLRPERRVVHAVRTADGAWWANLHAQVHSEAQALTDLRTGARELLGWAGADRPLVLGGDCNTRTPVAPGFALLGGHVIDHVLGLGWTATGTEVLDAGPLSDHRPVVVELVRAAAPGG